MAIDPNLVSIIPASELPTVNNPIEGELLYYSPVSEELQKGSITGLIENINGGFGEPRVATLSNTPPNNPETTKHEAFTAGTYTNWKDATDTPITLTGADVADNKVLYFVKDGVVEIVQKTPKKTPYDDYLATTTDSPVKTKSEWLLTLKSTPKTTFDSSDNTEASTMKAAADYVSENTNNFLKSSVSVNLVNRTDADFKENSFINTLGGIVDNNLMETSGFIKVVAGEIYTPSHNHNVVFFNKNKERTASLDPGRPNAYFTVPTGSRYVRFSGYKSEGQIKLVKGQYATFPTGIGAYKVSIKDENGYPVEIKTSELTNDSNFVKAISSTNLVNRLDADFKDNVLLATANVETTNSTYETTGYIKVNPSEVYTPSQKGNVVFFTKDKSYITGIDSSRANLYFTTPTNAGYVRIVGVKSVGQIKLVKGQFATFPAGIGDYKTTIIDENGYEIKTGEKVTKTSDLTNDSGFLKPADISGLVASTYLETNYRNKTQEESFVDGKVGAFVAGNSQIGNKSITQEKISDALWLTLSGGPVTITNNPDEEDITVSGGLLKIKDAANYIYLKKGVVITQAVVNTWVSKTVEIRHAHEVTANITFDSSVTLVFKGGHFFSSTPRTIQGGNARIIAGRDWIFRGIFDNLFWTPGGTRFTAEYAYPEWMGEGNGIEAGLAITRLSWKISAPASLMPNKIYEIESSAGNSIIGNGATLKRKPVSVDINILSAIPQATSTLTLTVDTAQADYSKLKVGMEFVFVNKEGSARKVDSGRQRITSISGGTITTRGFSTKMEWAAGEAQMVNFYPMVPIDSNGAFVDNCKLDGSYTTWETNNRTYWEVVNAVVLTPYVKNQRVTNCIITNSASEGITVCGLNPKIENNIIINCGGNGIHLSGCVGAIINHNYIADTNRKPLNGHNEGAITYSNNIYNTKITNNIFDGCLTGIGSIDAGFNSDSHIAFNTFRRYQTHGIDINARTGGGPIVDNMVITGNKFSGKYILKTYESWYMESINNNYNEATGAGVRVFGNGAAVQSVIISDNIFECASVDAVNAELQINGNSFIEKSQTFDVAVQPYVVRLQNIKGTFNNNQIISENNTNRQGVFDVTTSDLSVIGNYIRANTIQKTGQTMDLTNNFVTDL